MSFQSFTIHASAARTATRTDYLGGDPASDRQAAGNQLTGARAVTVVVSVTAKSGTTPTLDVVLEGSVDGASWYTLATVAQYADATGTKKASTTAGEVLPPFIRAVSTIAGTDPSFTFSVHVLAN